MFILGSAHATSLPTSISIVSAISRYHQKCTTHRSAVNSASSINLILNRCNLVFTAMSNALMPGTYLLRAGQESLLAWRRFVEKHTPDMAEIDLEAVGSTPLFDIRLTVAGGYGDNPCVMIVPGLSDIERALMSVVDDVVATVKVRHALC